MNIPWKVKSLIFRAIDALNAYSFLYFAQKYVTRRSRVKITAPDETWEFHKNNIKRLGSPKMLEFGAGKSLAQNIYLSESAKDQVVVDLFPMFDPALADDAAKAISKFGHRYSRIASIEDLSKYNILYMAPLNIAQSGFDDNLFDCCISTNTLEHIPQDAILTIFRELKRILRARGMVSAVIDYSDHYSHTDSSIGPLEFLRYSSKEYSRHNHLCHFQNRLRHHDYEAIFQETGFEILLSKPCKIASSPTPLSSEFDERKATTFATKGLFILSNRK